jgi:hypothetical protein
VALIRVSFGFMNLLPTSLLYADIVIVHMYNNDVGKRFMKYEVK